jgi:hypothetical protein
MPSDGPDLRSSTRPALGPRPAAGSLWLLTCDSSASSHWLRSAFVIDVAAVSMHSTCTPAATRLTEPAAMNENTVVFTEEAELAPPALMDWKDCP